MQDPTKHSLKTKNQRKAQECHLEKGKAAKPIKGMKSGVPSQNGKTERARKAQNQEKLKIKNSP
jgi:hypothetical protein